MNDKPFYCIAFRSKVEAESASQPQILVKPSVWLPEGAGLLSQCANGWCTCVSITNLKQVRAQNVATMHIVDCANGLIASQESSTKALVESISRLTNSINRAVDDSGRLASRIAILTLFLVLVGIGQIVVMAWPCLVWWFHNRGR